MTNVFSKLAEEAKPEKTGGEAGFFLATVATADSNGITFIPDGQTAATQKRYKMIASGPMPVEGDRVVVMKHSGTCVVLGIIGMPDEPVGNEYVLKAGDTMTGALGIKNVNYAVGGTPPSSNSYMPISFTDSADSTYAAVRGAIRPNGNVGLFMQALRTINGNSVANGYSMQISSSGDRSVAFDDPAIWRSALGLGTSGAFPLTIAQGGSGNTGTYYTTTVADICAASVDFSITNAQFASWGKLASVMVVGEWTRTTTTSGWVTAFTMNSDKRPKFEAMAKAWSNSNTYLYPSGAMYRSGTITSGVSETLFCTYLIA